MDIANIGNIKLYFIYIYNTVFTKAKKSKIISTALLETQVLIKLCG